MNDYDANSDTNNGDDDISNCKENCENNNISDSMPCDNENKDSCGAETCGCDMQLNDVGDKVTFANKDAQKQTSNAIVMASNYHIPWTIWRWIGGGIQRKLMRIFHRH